MIKKINVTQSFLPPKEEYLGYLDKLWESKWITNRGEYVLELENKLKKNLDLNYLTLTTNGTLPIQIALKSLPNNKKEIITTPFSYVATVSSIVWENFIPVFVDIDSKYLTIDETKIENAITNNTGAILATHVFGNPCNVEAIEKIAKKHRLKVIYDAAHCFGVNYKGKSVFSYGDISTCSFHATKIFHTGEGGMMVSKTEETHNQLFHKHNFGHKNEKEFYDVGVNAKMTEFQAALGLSVFKYFPLIKNERKIIVDYYIENIKSSNISFFKIRPDTEWNYHYFPIIFSSEQSLLKTVEKLNNKNIFPRRYFYPSLNKLYYIKNKVACPISEKISSTILCLPLFVGLKKEDQKRIIDIINGCCS